LIVEKIFFSGKSLHDLLMSTRVIDRRASVAQIHRVVENDAEQTGLGSALKFIVLVVVACLVLFFAMVLFSVFTAKPNPTRDAASAMAKSAKSLAKQSENYYYAQGAFPSTLSTLGLSKLPDEFDNVQFNETSGAFTLTISTNAAEPLRGKTMTLYPEFKKKKKSDTISKWRCGSKDIARDDQPFGCNYDVTALN
jgi:hypothetical protein